MTMKKLSFLLFLMLFTFVHASDIGLSPPRLELTGSPGQTITETVTVFTAATEQQQVAVEFGDWTLDPFGSAVFLPTGSSEFSATPWLELDANEFFLEANTSRDVRVSITIPDDADLAGSYQGMAFFRIVPQNADNTGVGVITTTRIGLAVYVTVAGTEESGSELVDFFQQDDESITLAVANIGNTVMRLGGHVDLRGEDGESVARLDVPNVPVLRDSEIELTLPLGEDVEPGFYVALALVEDNRGGLLAGELPIEVP